MGEHAPTTTPEEFRRLNRGLWRTVLDRAVSTPEWKHRLLDDPEAGILRPTSRRRASSSRCTPHCRRRRFEATSLECSCCMAVRM